MLNLTSLCVSAIVKSKIYVSDLRSLPQHIKLVLLDEMRKRDCLEPAVVQRVAQENCPSSLDLSNTSSLTEDVVCALKPKKNSVTELNLSKSPIVKQKAWLKLSEKLLDSLTTLDMSESHSRGVLRAFASKCTFLKVVKAESCPQLTDSEVSLILERSETLQELCLRKNTQLTDRCMRGLPSKSFLLRLDLRQCSSITDKTLFKIAHSCPVLISLSLEGQKFVNGITEILNCCTQLSSLAIPLCSIDEDSVTKIRNTNVVVR